MTRHDSMHSGPRVNSRILTAGGLLIGVGGLLSLAGAALITSALMKSARQWARESDMHPTELAHRKALQVRRAAGAGVTAWRSPEKETSQR